MNQISQPSVSFILPILNEERDLENCVSAILQQDYLGSIEIILALGPSIDKTTQIANTIAAGDTRIKLVDNPTGQTARGLNLAIKSSSYEIICRIDGHSEIDRAYIKTAVLIMQETGAVNVGGLMYANSEFGLQRTIAQAMRSKLGVGPSKFHTGGKAGASDTVYLGVFKKSAIIAAGGFDERYIRAQDWELNHRMRKQGGLIWFDPRLIVTYRPRNSFSKLAKQYFQYGRWRRVIARQHPQTVNYRYLAPPIAVVITLVSIFTGLFINRILILPSLAYIFLLLIGGFLIGKKLVDRLIMPFVLATMHFSWGVGFLTSPKKLFKD
ncbi:putative succinoglycan biosynthesis protein ExoA [Candidatus Nanopelagicus hibericus]|uniref:Putative succinoglycan biosynthesis protein ExoA n=1 Tax=Candidatus Nanopelagicus hibericus TaxID=1884915 RepID=A0A249K831_9ACTN|nr:glycosyltransferase family 2 protein [Candidatus Nanopelagicus hibericus]ASY12953.1 putative succinoglycan biosynthesis protein ExoA [Candidatus Nanopelagicus hibericus]